MLKPYDIDLYNNRSSIYTQQLPMLKYRECTGFTIECPINFRPPPKGKEHANIPTGLKLKHSVNEWSKISTCIINAWSIAFDSTLLNIVLISLIYRR